MREEQPLSFTGRSYRATRLPPVCPILLFLIIAFPVAGAVSVSVEAPSACPEGCSCMPGSQAAGHGYAPCSADQYPCFHDSFGRPLYCYRTVSGAGTTGCNSSTVDRAGETPDCSAGPGSAVADAMTINTSVNKDTANAPIYNPAPDLLTVISEFFQSLLGMK